MKRPRGLSVLILCAACSPSNKALELPGESTRAARLGPTGEEAANPDLKALVPKANGSAQPASTPAPLDHGIFPEFNSDVHLEAPPWLFGAAPVVATLSGVKYQIIDGYAAFPFTSSAGAPHSLSLLPEEQAAWDHDLDGIPDGSDVLLGAKKAVKNGAAYKNSYHELSFPGGDVPRSEGVCTDVVIRALRNAGYDLQALIAEDIKARPRAYPMVKKPDSNIDHRRVRTLLPYFKHAFREISLRPGADAELLLPGDIVFMNTMGDGEPEHMGIISDRLGKSGRPLLINNWNDGSVTAEMDLLPRVPVTHRFRIARRVSVDKVERGPVALLSRHQQALPERSGQLLLVTTALATSTGGVLRRFRRENETFVQVDEEIPVRIGRAGLGGGRGVGGEVLFPPPKKEGDGKAPAGVFVLGTAFGTSRQAPYRGAYPYRPVEDSDYWVDDPSSPLYNTWQTLGAGTAPPWSAEKLSMYFLGLAVGHNTNPVQPAAGSAIFLHPWKDRLTPTVGCTAMDLRDLKALLSWLRYEEQPVLAQLPGSLF